MPIVRIDLLEGRPAAAKAALIARVTAAVAETLAVSPENVRVLLTELPATHWAVGGVTMAERRRPGDGDDHPQ